MNIANALQCIQEGMNMSGGCDCLTQSVIRSDLNRAGNHLPKRFLVSQVGARKSVRLKGFIELCRVKCIEH